MAFLGKKELEDLLPSCIEDYDANHIDNVAYELCLGNEVYLTDSTSGKKEILDDKNSQVVIKPGQFALLLTQETVKLPDNVLAFISIKFSQKIKGLVNISGFHVDPGFNGKIIFSVYNAGPATIVLDKGERYFMIWFSELTSNSDPYQGSHQNQVKISAKQITDLQGELASPNALLERIKANEALLNNIKWAAGILIGLAIAIFLKTLVKTPEFNEYDNLVLKKEQAKEFIRKSANEYNIDSVITAKVDSILKRATK